MHYHIYDYAPAELNCTDYTVLIENTMVGLHKARVSAYPFNRRWPGHQRSIDQTEEVAFAAFSMSAPVHITVNPHRTFKNVTIRPLSRNVAHTVSNGEIHFVLPQAGYYSLELDGQHRALHIFADAETSYKAMVQGELLYYGKGFHDAGTIVLHSNQTLWLDEGAVVYANVYAADAENIRIIGTGILDNSKNKEVIVEAVETGDGSIAVDNAVRTHTIQLEFCKNILIDGITIRDSLVYNIRPLGCMDLKIQHVKIIGCWRYNSDGIDMHNCIRSHISDCFIRTFDDSICIKGFDCFNGVCESLVHNGIAYETFSDVIVERCVIWNDWNKSLEIGAETRAEAIHGVRFSDCDIIHAAGPLLDILNVDYANIYDVSYENIRIECNTPAYRPAFQKTDADTYPPENFTDYVPPLISLIIMKHPEYSAGLTRRGKIHDIRFKNIYVTAPHMPLMQFIGYDTQHRVLDIDIADIYLNSRPVTKEMLQLRIEKHAARIRFQEEML